MTEFNFSLGVLLGIFLSLGVDILKEILVKKYTFWKTKKDNKTQIKEDLKANISTLSTMWENHKTSRIIYNDFKTDLNTQLREIITFYTSSAKDIDDLLIRKIRETSSKFLELIDTSEIDWFDRIQQDGDKLCDDYKQIVQDL